MRSNCHLLLMFLLSVNLFAPGQENSPFFAAGANGMISGTVLDANGQVAEGARVCISLTSGDPKSGMTTEIACPISADKYGQFQFEHLKVGTYRVFAQNAAEHSAVDAEKGLKATLTADGPYAHVTLRLKPGGILLGSVTDASSGKPVEQFELQYVELDHQGGGTSFEQNGKFWVVVPVATDLVIILTAQGYQGWVYTDSDNQSRPMLKVAAGERKQLDIELQPLPPGAGSGPDSSPSSAH